MGEPGSGEDTISKVSINNGKHENNEVQHKNGLSYHDNMAYAKLEDDQAFYPSREKLEYDDPKKPRMTSRKLLIVICILITEMCERLTFYSVGANMVLYGTSVLEFSSITSANVSNIFNGIVYLVPLLGGFVSDVFAGKFKTIIGGTLIYIVGLVLLPVSAVEYKQLFGKEDDDSFYDLSVEARRGLFLASLVFIAIGTGGIKANVGPFGAQQLRDLGDDAVQSFFNWFYWFINVGSLIAYTGVAYVQQNVSFAWGFFVPLISMIIALIVFFSARTLYIHLPPSGSVMSQAFAVCCEVCNKPTVVVPGQKVRKFDSARKKYGGSHEDEAVDGVRIVLGIIPVFITIIMYWAIYSQMQTTFFFQGERLDVRVGNVLIPASGLNAFNTIIIIILIPIVDRGLYPLLNRVGRPLTYLQRIGIGYILAALSVIVAGGIEIIRKNEMAKPGGMHVQELGGEKFNASSLSVFVQVSEFALVGASEVFTSVSGIEFAYTQAPKSMQGILTGLFYISAGLGNFLSDGILNAVEAASRSYPWFSDEINNAHVEYFFFLLGGLMFLDFLLFLVVAYFYRYNKSNQQTYKDSEKQQEKTSESDEFTHF